MQLNCFNAVIFVSIHDFFRMQYNIPVIEKYEVSQITEFRFYNASYMTQTHTFFTNYTI